MNMIRTILLHDWWTIRQSATYKILAAVFIGCLLLAAFNGRRIYLQQQATHVAIETTAQAMPEKHRVLLKQIEANGGQYQGSPFADPRSPYTAGNKYAPQFLLYPLHPLAQWSVGQSDIYPTYYRVTASKMQSLILNEEIANPQVQFTGYFDMAFVLVYLLPLLIIGFTYNLGTAERESGTLRMLLSEPVAFRQIIATRFLFRFVLTSITLWSLLLIMAWITRIPLRGSGWLAFTTGAWLYSLFWFAMSWFLNALSRKNSGTTAGLLLGTWLCFVLLIPGMINLMANSLYPIPSRIDLITETREAAADVSKRSSAILGKYLQDHPELVKDTAGMNPNDFAVRTFTALIETERTIAPLEETFETQLARQQRLTGQWGYLSPALLLQSFLNGTAGTSENELRDFRKHVKRSHALYREYITNCVVGQKKFTSATIGEIPAPPVYRSKSSTQWSYYGYLILVAGLLTVAGMVSFKKQ